MAIYSEELSQDSFGNNFRHCKFQMILEPETALEKLKLQQDKKERKKGMAIAECKILVYPFFRRKTAPVIHPRAGPNRRYQTHPLRACCHN
jgi:hypothetical protein